MRGILEEEIERDGRDIGRGNKKREERDIGVGNRGK